MKFEEVLPLIREGKMVITKREERNFNYPSAEFIIPYVNFVSENKFLTGYVIDGRFIQNPDSVSMQSILSDKWEIFNEV